MSARKTQEHPQCQVSTDPGDRGIGYTNLSKNLHDLNKNVSDYPVRLGYWLSLSTVHHGTSQLVPGNTGCLNLIALTMH